MKFVKYLFVVFATMTFISACQKELNFDVDGFAHGSLKSNATGDCLPSTINGIFRKDSVLDNTNFIDIQVDLTNTGTYEIKSDTVNGYFFKGNGTLGIVGINTVRLYGSGKPTVSGTDVFTIRFDTSVCKINVTVIGPGIGVAVFTLGGSPGACSGAIVNGTYTQGTLLDVSNTALITVNVTATGTYTFGAVSSNGVAFRSVGVFTALGVQSITMNGVGLPLNPGITNVTALNNTATSTCTFSVTVLPSGGSTAAVFTLNGVPGTCSGAVSNGTYTAGTVLAASNTVTLNVTVLTAGTYSVTSNAINGISFSATGNFATTGVQTITLSGTGTPTAAGAFNYTATAGISNCTFSITVVGISPINNEYMLFTTNSNFSQRLVGGTPADTVYIRVGPNPILINSLNYSIYQGVENGVVLDSAYFRKNNGKYYNNLNTASLGFDNASLVDYMLLDSSLAIGGTWISDLGTNTLGGMAVTIKANNNIIAKGATAIIAGNTYTNVIKVHYLFSYNNGTVNINFQENEIWFAKGLGFIYFKVIDVPVTTTAEEETTRIQVF